MPDFLSRQEHLSTVGSTNDVVREWLDAGTSEVCLVDADEQLAGRGRDGRTWQAPRGAALLVSLGFRPRWLAPERVWQLAATVSLAMADAAEVATGLSSGTIRMKWPNDLAIESTNGSSAASTPGSSAGHATTGDPRVGKVAGVLGETDGLGTDDPRAIIGIGVNVEWAADEFPRDLAGSMTSLSVATGAGRIDRGALLAEFIPRLEGRVVALRSGQFDGRGWQDRQATTGRLIDLLGADGETTSRHATGVDTETGALIVEDPESPTGERRFVVGEITHVRFAPPVAGRV